MSESRLAEIVGSDEATDFQKTAVIINDDGKEIDFRLQTVRNFCFECVHGF